MGKGFRVRVAGTHKFLYPLVGQGLQVKANAANWFAIMSQQGTVFPSRETVGKSFQLMDKL
jgi:hypothetical protein